MFSTDTDAFEQIRAIWRNGLGLVRFPRSPVGSTGGAGDG
jgi:hypothetical protein